MITVVFSCKGGVAKTTTAIHLACYIQEAGYGETLLIDADPNRSAIAWSERGDNSLPVKTCSEKAAIKLIPSYKHIVIDSAARPQEDEIRELVESADLVILPTSPDALSLDALGEAIAILNKLKFEKYKVLLTICPPKPNRDAELAMDFLKGEGLPILKNSIKRLVAFPRAALKGVPVWAYQPDGKDAWKLYERVGKEIYSDLLSK